MAGRTAPGTAPETAPGTAPASEAALALRSLSATEFLWRQLARPVNPWAAAESLVGMSQGAARVLAAVLLLSSREAAALLDAMPGLSRSLSLTTLSRPDRSAGELRGPILWSETMAARAASAGDPSTFVFSIAARAYDTAENRTLATALTALVEAGRTIDTRALRRRNAELAGLIGERSLRAQRWLQHRALVDVPRRASKRDRHRTRAGARRRHYEAALDLLERHAVPLTADELAAAADARTRTQHAALVALIRGLRLRNVEVPPLELHHGIVEGGPVRYVHERSRGGRLGGGPGIFIGGYAIDVPAVVDGHLIRVGAQADGDPGPAHLYLAQPGNVAEVLAAAGF